MVVSLFALLLVVGLAGVAVQHYRPQWLADLHLTHHSPSTAGARAATQTPARGSAATNSTNSSGSHHSSSSNSQVASNASNGMVTTAQSGSSSSTVEVHASSYTVLIAAQKPCWIDATSPATSSPLFVGVLAAGQSKSLVPVGGRMSVQFGASYVTVQIQVSGRTVTGWSFTPHLVPYTLNLATAKA